MRIPCRRVSLSGGHAALLLALACAPAEPPVEPGAAVPYPEAAAAAVLAEVGSEAPAGALLARARTAAVRLRTDATTEELEPLGREMTLCVQALTLVDGAAELPWETWILEDRSQTPALATELLRAAVHVLPAAESVRLAALNDLRTVALPLRLEAHRVLWTHDPGLAAPRARAVFFREQPRAQDLLRPEYVEHVLAPLEGESVDRLLQEIAVSDTMESRARRLALRALAGRDAAGSSALAESVFDTEATDLMVRQEALRTMAALDRTRAMRVLEEKLPDPNVQPVLYGFMVDLRDALLAEEDR